MLKKRMKKIWLLLAIALSLLAIALASNWNTSSQADFDLGTYTNTHYDADVVKLNSAVSGDYTSRIFDASLPSTWNNISWTAVIPSQTKMFVVDGAKDVFSSSDGIFWNTQTINYGGTNDLDGLIATSSGILVLLDNKDIYSSSNNGVNWTKINDLFTPYSENGKVMEIDSNNNIFIIDANERVFKSTNSGYNWTEVCSDFNPGKSNNVKGIAIDSSNTLFVVDGSGDVYSSFNQGVNWTFVSDFGSGSDIDGLSIDQNNFLYILLNKDVYQSTDSGANWTKVNDLFTPYSNNGLLIFFDKVDSLIIADANGRIFKSNNQGVNWTELGDCNGAASNNPKAAAAFSYSTSLDISVRSCDDASCTGESFTDIPDVSPQNLAVADNRYFQFRFDFSTNNVLFSPELSDVFVDYTLLNVAPAISVNDPGNNVFVNNVWLNVSVIDVNNDLMTVWFFVDEVLVNTQINIASGSDVKYNWPSLDGLHNWSAVVSDGTVNVSSDYYYFSVDSIAPALTITNPVNAVYRIDFNENTLNLNYVVSDNNLNSCWFTNLSNKNQTLAGCNNGIINIPDTVNDNNYVIMVYSDDLSGNMNSSQVSFSTNYSQGLMNNAVLNLSLTALVNEEFNFNSSAVCANDWCEDVVVSLGYDDVNCNLTNGNAQNNKGDLNAADIVTELWSAKCSAAGTYTFTINYSTEDGVSQILQNISVQEQTENNPVTQTKEIFNRRRAVEKRTQTEEAVTETVVQRPAVIDTTSMAVVANAQQKAPTQTESAENTNTENTISAPKTRTVHPMSVAAAFGLAVIGISGLLYVRKV